MSVSVFSKSHVHNPFIIRPLLFKPVSNIFIDCKDNWRFARRYPEFGILKNLFTLFRNVRRINILIRHRSNPCPIGS